MTDLGQKLREILFKAAGGISDLANEEVAQILQAVEEAGYKPTDVREKADKLFQDMTNLHTRMYQDMLRLGLTPTPVKHTADFSHGQLSELMTGQEVIGKCEAAGLTGLTIDRIKEALNVTD